MPTFVWTDEVPEWRRAFLTPGKRYHLKLGTVVGDDDDEVVVSLCDDREFDQYGRAWNVEIVADPEPEPSEMERLLAGIRAEIDWHEAEAANLRKLEAADAIHSWSFKSICRMRAEHYEAAATRLRKMLAGIRRQRRRGSEVRREKDARDLLAARVTVAGRSMTVAELIAAHERAVEALREAMDRGLIYWEPQTTRGHIAKADMLCRFTAILAALPEPPAPTETEGA